MKAQVSRSTCCFVYGRDHQLIRANPRASVYLACGLLMRGSVEVSDINANIQRLQSEVRMIHWNQEGFKVGVCSVPPVGQKSSLLCLSNNCCIRETFERLNARFHKLYSRKAHLHHYTEFMDAGVLDEAQETVRYLVGEYAKLERSSDATLPAVTPRTRRLQPLF
jgi:tubulin epsilon